MTQQISDFEYFAVPFLQPTSIYNLKMAEILDCFLMICELCSLFLFVIVFCMYCTECYVVHPGFVREVELTLL